MVSTRITTKEITSAKKNKVYFFILVFHWNLRDFYLRCTLFYVVILFNLLFFIFLFDIYLFIYFAFGDLYLSIKVYTLALMCFNLFPFCFNSSILLRWILHTRDEVSSVKSYSGIVRVWLLALIGSRWCGQVNSQINPKEPMVISVWQKNIRIGFYGLFGLW